MVNQSFFKDLIITELSSVLAGPSVGMFFAELGAKVHKIENALTKGDVTRNWTIHGENQLPSAYYASINFNKQVHFLDLTEDEDRQALTSLIAKSDIVISNYQPIVAEKLSLRYEDVRKVKNDLIFLELGGFEEHDRPAFDVVLQAETGWISMTGNGNSPAKLPVALIDVLAGHQLKEAALLAIIHKLKTGEGSYVNCSLEKSSLSALMNQATNYLMNGAIAKPIGSQHPNIAPYGDWFTTKDNIRFVLAVGSEKHFQSLWNLLELDEQKRVKLFSSNTERLTNRTSLNAELQSKFQNISSVELFDRLGANNVPYGEIKDISSVLSSNVAQSMVLWEKIEGRDTSRLSSIAFNASFFENP